VVVLGDCNDGLGSPAIVELERAGLVDLMDSVPADDRYTYVFQGRSQILDHVLTSPALLECCAPTIDVVHGNAESPAARRISDHDPVVARFRLATTPR
jgi:predicted extracellular nuclease